MTRETRTLKDLFPDPKPPRRKNFIKENVKSLRKMEQLFHTNSKSAKDFKLPNTRQTKIVNKVNNDKIGDCVTSSKGEFQKLGEKEISENNIPHLLHHKPIVKNQNNRKTSAPVILNKKSIKKLPRTSVNSSVSIKNCAFENLDHIKGDCHNLKAYSDGELTNEKLNGNIGSDKTNAKCKNQGVQTLDTKNLNELYCEGVIRYPSGKDKEKPKFVSTKVKNDTNSTTTDVNKQEITDKLHNSNDDNEKSNNERISLASKLVSQLNNSAPPPSYRVGVVPKYIKERKEALKKEHEAKCMVKQTDCPPGHVPLPDSERKETLNMLKKHYQEYVNELNMLPIRTDTLRSQKRKMEIEKQLAKLEEGIKVFSRPKVFVKIDS